MKKKIDKSSLLWCSSCVLFVLALGFPLHFLYEWSGQNPAVALFSPVNESVWEHQKLLVFPYLLFLLAEYFFRGKNQKAFPAAALLSLLSGMAAMLVSFYTYSGIIGFNCLPADIATFALSAVTASAVFHRLLRSRRLDGRAAQILSLAGITALIALLFLFTFRPPHLALFLDPVSRQFGPPVR